MNNKFPVSIVVITLNEEKNIKECIESILKQDYDDYELIIVDGESKDKTLQIVKSYTERHKNIRLIMDPGSVQQNTSRNLGIRNAKYDHVAFTDADCIVPKDWLSILAKKFSEYKKIYKNLAAVGGANIPYQKEKPRFNNAVAIAFDSFIGSAGSIQAKPYKKDDKVVSLSCTNVLFDKSKLFSIGLFPVFKRKMGDDWIIGVRLNKKGYVLIGLKDSYVLHRFRPTPKRFWKNMLLYGSVRIGFIKMYPKDNGIIYYLPILFLLVMVSSILSFMYKLFLIPLLYFPLILLYSFYLSLKKKHISLTFDVFFVFLLLHFGYSVGELIGLQWLFKKI